MNEKNSPNGFFTFSLIFIAAAVILGLLARQAPRPVSPASLDQPVTVVLDPGHGGEDGGACTYGGMSEKELNLLIASEVYQMLSVSGVRVIMTRSDDRLLYDPNADHKGHKKSMDLAARLRIASETPNSILLSIHMNAFPETKYGGLQVYYSPNSEGSRVLAELIQENNRTRLSPTNGRRSKEAGRSIYLLDRFEGTGVLIECGFLSNPDDRERLNSESYRHELSALIFGSILQYLSEGGK